MGLTPPNEQARLATTGPAERKPHHYQEPTLTGDDRQRLMDRLDEISCYFVIKGTRRSTIVEALTVARWLATGDVKKWIELAIVMVQMPEKLAKPSAAIYVQRAIDALAKEWVVNERRVLAKLNVASCFSKAKGIHRSTIVKTLTEARKGATSETVRELIEKAIHILQKAGTKAEADVLIRQALKEEEGMLDG